VSAKSDVFSLGATAWEALVGRPLIEEQAPSRMLEEIRRGRFCAPGDRRAGVPAEVSRAILSALAPSPEDRITPLELATTLRASCAPTTQAERARLVLPVAKAKLNKLAATRAVTEALEVANLPPSGNAASRSRRALGTLRTWLPSALARFLRVG
jgi:serine/threonine protein kinase